MSTVILALLISNNMTLHCRLRATGTVKVDPQVPEMTILARENTFESNVLLSHLGVWLLYAELWMVVSVFARRNGAGNPFQGPVAVVE